MKFARTAALLSSILAAATMTLMWAPASQAVDSPVMIQNVDSTLCLSLNPQDYGKDIQVVQEPCDFGPEQSWRLLWTGAKDVGFIARVQNVATGMCLRAVSNHDFSVVDTIDCTDISNEKWAFDYPTIVSEISSGGHLALDVYEDWTTPGNTIDVFHQDSTGAQKFNVLSV